VGTKDSAIRSVINPRTGKADFQFTVMPDAELVALCGRLRKGQEAWAASPVDHRVEVMQA